MNKHWLKWGLRLTALAVGVITLSSLALAWNSSGNLAWRVSPETLAPIVGLMLVSFSIRVARFYFFMRAGKIPILWRQTLVIQLVGVAMSLTPGRIGEIFKLHLIREYKGTPIMRTAPVLMLDRVTEGMGFLALALAAATAVPTLQSQVPSAALIVVGFTALLGFALARYTLKERRAVHIKRWRIPARAQRLVPYAKNLWCGLQATCTVPQIAGGVFLTSIARGVDGLVVFSAARLVGLDIPPATAIFILAISGLAGGISFLPAGVGAVETTMTGLLVLSGATLPTALAIALLARITTLWVWGAIGLAVVFLLPLARQEQTNIAYAEPPTRELPDSNIAPHS